MGLTEKEQSGRNYLKEKKPLVFEKVSKFTEKFQRGEALRSFSCSTTISAI